MIYILAGILAGALVAAWLAGFWYTNDLSVPSGHIPNVKKVLVIFPHADDETNIAGLAWLIGKYGMQFTVVVLTRGENGTPDATRDERLRAMRAEEMHRVCDRLGGTLIQEDFGDGQLDKKQHELTRYVRQLLDSEQPDLVVTYDLAGLYGHPDHIQCTAVVTKLMASRSSAQLWYVTAPARLSRAMNWPTHMARDPAVLTRRSQPTLRVFVGRGVFAKIASVYNHKSQRASFRSAMPFGLPIWFVYSLQLFEYYHQVE